MRALTVWVAALAVAASGCGVIVKGGPLSSRGNDNTKINGLYMTTGSSPRPWRTVGFIQIRGYGVSVAGVTEVGDAALDGTIKGRLADEARKMGGDAVVHIEFLDENPQTPVERAQAMSQTVSASYESGAPQVQTKDRYVTVTGEVIQFVDR